MPPQKGDNIVSIVNPKEANAVTALSTVVSRVEVKQSRLHLLLTCPVSREAVIDPRKRTVKMHSWTATSMLRQK